MSIINRLVNDDSAYEILTIDNRVVIGLDIRALNARSIGLMKEWFLRTKS